MNTTVGAEVYVPHIMIVPAFKRILLDRRTTDRRVPRHENDLENERLEVVSRQIVAIRSTDDTFGIRN
jgi:hypothetical protein